MVVYTVYNLQRRRYNCTDSDHNIIESLTQVHRMNLILECNVLQVMAFRRVKVEVEACLGTINRCGACVYIKYIVDDVPCFPVAFNAWSTIHVL